MQQQYGTRALACVVDERTQVHAVRVNERGSARLLAGHPWVYRSDVLRLPTVPGFAPVEGPHGQPLGWAAVHPSSQIAVRLLHRGRDGVDEGFVLRRLDQALARRAALQRQPEARMQGVDGYRLVHAEADGLPGLVVDRLGSVVTLQNGSAALEPSLPRLAERLLERLGGEGVVGVLGRLDAAVREREGLPREVRVLAGEVPERVTVSDGVLRWPVEPRAGQKTGVFLDQRLNHQRLARYARGRALDVFSYHGGFGLHLLHGGANEVELIDASADALAAAQAAALLNGLPAPRSTRADAFEQLRALERQGARYDVIALDPPALAKRVRDLPRALAGYKELNLRAIGLLAPGGVLGTATCSAHVQEAEFLNVLADAAADAGRTMHVLGRYGAAPDHPERLGFPESAYLSFVLLQAVD